MIPRRILHLKKEIERVKRWIPQYEKYHYGKILKLELRGLELELSNLKQEIKGRHENPDSWFG